MQPEFLNKLEMAGVKDYKISFSGLKVGEHEFEYQIFDSFFEAFEHSRTQKADLLLKVNLTKTETLLQLRFLFKGSVEVVCDHCGNEFDYPLDFSENLIVKFSDQEQEDTDEVIFLPTSAFQFDLSQLIYEYVNLALPMRLTHPEDESNNLLCTNDVLDNFEEPEEPEKENNPMWEALKKLK